MKRFLLFTLMLTMFAPSLVQAAVANVAPEVKAAVQSHDHSSHNKQSEIDSTSGDVYIATSNTAASALDRTIEKIDFSLSGAILPSFSIDLSLREVRAPPGWKNESLATVQPSLILTTGRFRI